MEAHIAKDGSRSAALFEHLPSLLDKPRFANELRTILLTLQAKKASGDGKREQAKMSELLELAQKRVGEVE